MSRSDVERELEEHAAKMGHVPLARVAAPAHSEPRYPNVGETADFAGGFASGAASYSRLAEAIPEGSSRVWIEGYRAGRNAAVRALTDFACTAVIA